MRFVPSSEENDEQKAMIKDLDDLVQFLASQDFEGRRASERGDMEKADQVAQSIGMTIGSFTWQALPTIVMHFAGHVNMARQEAGRLSMTCQGVADGLTSISQTLSEAGVPLEVCASLMDLAVELRKAADDCLYEVAEGNCDEES